VKLAYVTLVAGEIVTVTKYPDPRLTDREKLQRGLGLFLDAMRPEHVVHSTVCAQAFQKQ
jgi:hypothetical protein